MSNYEYDQADESQDAWKRQMLESRERSRDALSECSGPQIDNWQSVNPPELVQYLHSQVLDYHRHVAPKSGGLPPEMWDEELTCVGVPATQTIDAGMTNWYGEFEAGDILSDAGWADKPVALDSLRQEWLLDSSVVVEVVVEDRTGGTPHQELRQFDLYLPPAACDAVVSQLDRCLDNLGWLPEAEEIDIGEESEVLR